MFPIYVANLCFQVNCYHQNHPKMTARMTVCSVSDSFSLVSGPKNLYHFISGKILKFVWAIVGIQIQNILSEPKTKNENRTSVEILFLRIFFYF